MAPHWQARVADLAVGQAQAAAVLPAVRLGKLTVEWQQSLCPLSSIPRVSQREERSWDQRKEQPQARAGRHIGRSRGLLKIPQ